ncbi:MULTISPECIES: YicC/YloC family endoribonuclease [Enterococcus]|uniref:YicC/YloC family endoribonuclease n=1 Tax=Enterococcus TaxID=1350 RepID=UPI00065E964B|nr:MULTISPECIES: YicC/YloC family endoribonuclease [Enterococcus]KAF1300866.1 YicC family protein [Enterococcus sp. JM9B]
MKSMTGFGKAISESDQYQIEVEIKSVNHRFLDIQLRSPKQLNSFEGAIRQKVKEHLQRGRVEIYVTLTEKGDTDKEIQVHWSLIEQLVKELQQGSKERFGETDFSPARLLEELAVLPDFVEVKQKKAEDELLESLVLQAIDQALAANVRSRTTEGEQLRQVLAANGTELSNRLADLMQFSAEYETDFRGRFEKKLQEYLGESVDQERLLTEMVLLLERSDIHEEIDRMAIHLKKFAVLVAQDIPVGRELDFLIQEMNREINTIGSKSSPIEIKELVVQMKTIVEKIREQVQNIE